MKSGGTHMSYSHPVFFLQFMRTEQTTENGRHASSPWKPKGRRPVRPAGGSQGPRGRGSSSTAAAPHQQPHGTAVAVPWWVARAGKPRLAAGGGNMERRGGPPAAGRGRRRTRGPAVVEEQQQRCCSATMARPRERERRGWKREKWASRRKGSGVRLSQNEESEARWRTCGEPRHHASSGLKNWSATMELSIRFKMWRLIPPQKITETAIFSPLQLSNRWMVCLSDFTFV
jgi:hypothetical protein